MIDKKRLIKAIAEGEGLFQEFKISLEKVDRTMVAFANTKGGVIFLGVDDLGDIRSFNLSNRMKAQIQDIAKNIDPPLEVSCIDLKKAAAIIVNEGENKPYKCSDGFFIRVGATNQKLSRDQILDIAVQFNSVRFESLQDLRFEYPRDFSEVAFRDFVDRSNLEHAYKTMGLEDFLISLSVCERQGGRLIFNNAGILFFAKNPQQFMPQAKLNYTRYQGVSKTHIVDRMVYSGTLSDQLDKVYKKLLFDIPVGYKLADQETRQEFPAYPLRALEEAIINALIHRDYYESGAEIMIDYFSDRIEVSNPGSLMGSLTLDKLGNKSLRRNPIIAELMYRLEKGEKLGSGIARMRALMNEWKLLPPNFELDEKFFSVIFVGPKHKISEEKVLMLSPRLKEFLEKQNQVSEPFTTLTYASLLNVSQRTAQKDLEILIQKKIVKKEGKGKGTHYRFTSG
ncbi:MAG: ATP-binding protein [Pseudomonadota bacterium]